MLRRIHPVLMILLLLAAYGFVQQLVADPVNTLLIIGLSALLFFVISNYLKSGRFLPSAPKSYQPKQKSAPQRPQAKKQGQPARKPFPFRVIEGNKGKAKQEQEKQDQQNNTYH